MIVYKKVRQMKDGTLKPLFIGKTKPFIINEWQHCEFIPTKGFAERSLGIDDDGNELGGWHACFTPNAPHIADELANGEKRIWVKCEAKGKTQTYDRPESQGGAWILVEWIKPMEVVA